MFLTFSLKISFLYLYHTLFFPASVDLIPDPIFPDSSSSSHILDPIFQILHQLLIFMIMITSYLLLLKFQMFRVFHQEREHSPSNHRPKRQSKILAYLDEYHCYLLNHAGIFQLILQKHHLMLFHTKTLNDPIRILLYPLPPPLHRKLSLRLLSLQSSLMP